MPSWRIVLLHAAVGCQRPTRKLFLVSVYLCSQLGLFVAHLGCGGGGGFLKEYIIANIESKVLNM